MNHDLRHWLTLIETESQTVDIGGAVIRPIHNSEGNLIAPTTKAQIKFWHWFAKSKIVDSHGRPLVVHRGDKPGKSEFSGLHWTKDPGYNQGNIFFSSERDIAKGYTSHRGSSYLASNDMDQSHGLYSVYLKVEKPVVVDAKGKQWDSLPLSGWMKKEIPSHTNGVSIQIDDLASHIQHRKKNDGLVVKNVWDQFGDGTQFVVFSNKQIKTISEIMADVPSVNSKLQRWQAWITGYGEVEEKSVKSRQQSDWITVSFDYVTSDFRATCDVRFVSPAALTALEKIVQRHHNANQFSLNGITGDAQQIKTEIDQIRMKRNF